MRANIMRRRCVFQEFKFYNTNFPVSVASRQRQVSQAVGGNARNGTVKVRLPSEKPNIPEAKGRERPRRVNKNFTYC
ncbi:hypothetical protein J6590_001440 [Homalodisca vitripennis]|nr:hypothetical protein J6590_001440 [Homalodisca vitripennis]